MTGSTRTPVSFLPALVSILLGAVYMVFFLAGESQLEIFGLLLGACLVLLLLRRFKILERVGRSAKDHSMAFGAAAVAATVAISLYFYDDNFVLFLVATVLVYTLTCLGLNIQFGFVGVVNFAGASFFGVGCYTAAILTKHTATPHLLVLLLGGLAAAALGFIVLVPVLKTRGHYSALVTIAFALLFKTFLEVNDTLGGPQGLKCDGLNLFGWNVNQDIVIGSFEGSFYLGYIAVALALCVLGFILARRLEDSWVGLNMDAVRLDETVSACFGQSIPKAKITAFTLGNFYCGVAGALFAMMLGYIAPTNFTFGDSLILLSIVILGGLGSLWGSVAATTIIIIMPEKFQMLQEYRFLLFAALVIAILLFRPQGLLPRPLRAFLTLRSR
ncbi:branched-chain amino acid ABC transporter permease [Desulfoferula mesophila]|uniref:Branched-chain amino acid ABC transporter permease n=1 Tax=Desulfoferula mesophila TaxID=3058419 RepID=A0AAU9EPY9_9BACT|nr:branched-chain amino acid ABC transporter permease [Desulfoferula mesophilus]